MELTRRLKWVKVKACYSRQSSSLSPVRSDLIGALHRELCEWREALPVSLQLGSTSNAWEACRTEAGLLAILEVIIEVCLCEIHLLPSHNADRPQYTLLNRFRFADRSGQQVLTDTAWHDLASRSRVAMSWLIHKGHIVLDIWMMGFYCVGKSTSIRLVSSPAHTV